MITRWAIPIAGIDPARITINQLHAVASRLADREHWASPKPWSARPVRFIDGIPVLEIVTLTDPDAEFLLNTATAGTTVDFGPRTGLLLTEPQPVETTTWDELYTATPPATGWTVQFQTPATFGNGSRFSPWPDPTAVARSLTNRWNTFNPDPAQQLDTDPRTWRTIWVSDVEGHTELQDIPQRTVPAFFGHIHYHCEDPATTATTHRLLRFAEYAGIGRYTTRGLGVAFIHTDHPPPSDLDHSGVAGGSRKYPRSVQAPHQHKHPKTTALHPSAEVEERRSVQTSHKTADQTG